MIRLVRNLTPAEAVEAEARDAIQSAPPTTLLGLAATAAIAAGKFLTAGCPLVDASTHLTRSVECSLCVLPTAPETDPETAPLRPGWDAHSGRCQVCGCYALKLRLATETCPLGRWPSA